MVFKVTPDLSCGHAPSNPLPHPVRERNNSHLHIIGAELDCAGMTAPLADPEAGERAIGERIQALYANHPAPFANAFTEHWSQLERAMYAAVCLTHQRRGGYILRATDALETMLSHTDIDASLPTSMFVPPHPALYLQFGPTWQERMRSVLGPMLALTGASPDEVTPHGCYLLHTRTFCPSCQRNQRTIGLYLVVEFEDPPGQFSMGGAADERLHDEDAPLTETLVNKLDGQVPGGLFGKLPAVLVDLLAKLFLYMQTDTAQIVQHNELGTLLQRLSGVGSKKQGKLERRAERLYDWVEVGPDHMPSPLNTTGADVNSEITPHWRRGHLRQQAHGPQHSLRKVVFIAPTMVRADRLTPQPGKTQP